MLAAIDEIDVGKWREEGSQLVQEDENTAGGRFSERRAGQGVQLLLLLLRGEGERRGKRLGGVGRGDDGGDGRVRDAQRGTAGAQAKAKAEREASNTGVSGVVANGCVLELQPLDARRSSSWTDPSWSPFSSVSSLARTNET